MDIQEKVLNDVRVAVFFGVACWAWGHLFRLFLVLVVTGCVYGIMKQGGGRPIGRE